MTCGSGMYTSVVNSRKSWYQLEDVRFGTVMVLMKGCVEVMALFFIPQTLKPTFHTLNPTPHTLNPTPHTLNPTPHTLNPTPHTLNPNPSCARQRNR